ncbi:hypothetical protein K7395_24440 [Streptomyces filamentosus]|uniref:Integral membrane protein n=3 Tax=Streptomyces TaxID=1883 RepID=A0ABY4V271_STRFL|nr:MULTISPECIES: hypothetical protein [Streptomyces]EFE74627.1 predicted protein [Streptomyces filamentosus NRRL 15998]EWS91730.1 hypothetical protein SSIG_02180 [Streptomyces filamentosus NRRL 11379]MYR78748.1 hypothetical protein [Streptomyces sp. SID5466]USC49640.1 hypothetical protein K7395_24440 [Streptomyces filamentosus]
MSGTVSSPRRRAVASGAPAAGAPVPSAPRIPRPIRLAAHAAALTPVPSGLWRIAIALGWDSGFTDEHLRPENFPGAESFHLIGLSLLAEAVGLLTLGLIHRWGEELPYWVPFLGGRRIPVPAAVIPASTGAALVTLITVSGAFNWNDVDTMGAPGSPEGVHYWVMTACYLPLLAWGPLLAVVTAAYYRRRRRER